VRYESTCAAIALLWAVAATSGAPVSWVVDSSGLWATPANWSSNPALPGSADDVTIDRPAGDFQITLSGGTQHINSLLLNEALHVTGGTLRANTTVSFSKSFNVNGGTLMGGTYVATGSSGIGLGSGAGGGVSVTGATLDCNATVFSGSFITVTGGLAISQGRQVRLAGTPGSAVLRMQGSQILSGEGTVLFDGSGDSNCGIEPTGGSLTISPDITVRTGASGGFVGQNGLLLVNQGTVSSETAGRTVSIRGTNWRNEGDITASGGGTVQLEGTLAVGGLGNFSGDVRLVGTLNNTGFTTVLSNNLWATTGSINGGTVMSNGASQLLLGNGTGGGGTLTGLLLNTNATVFNAGVVTVVGGLHIAEGRTVQLNGTSSTTALRFSGTQTLDGLGQIVMDGFGSNPRIEVVSGTLTIGPGVTVRSGTTGGVVGTFGRTLVNQGLIVAEGSGRSVVVTGTDWRNEGLISASDSGDAILEGVMTSIGGFQVDTGGRVVLVGTLNNVKSELVLDGSIGQILTFAGSGRVVGGTIFVPNGVPGALHARIGTSVSSAVSKEGDPEWSNVKFVRPTDTGRPSPKGAATSDSSASPNLPGLDSFAGVVVNPAARLTIDSGLTIGNATIVLNPNTNHNATIRFVGSQVLEATTGRPQQPDGPPGPVLGTIAVQGTSVNGNGIIEIHMGTLSIGEGVYIRALDQLARVRPVGPSDFIVCAGTITSESDTATVTIEGAAQFTNNGTLWATGGGSIVAQNNGTALTNLSGTTLSGGVYRVEAGSSMDFGSASITTNAATIDLRGQGSSFPALAALASNEGTLTLADGRAFGFGPTGGVFSNSGVFVKSGAGATTVPGSVTFDNAGSLCVERDLLAFDGPLILGDGGTLQFSIGGSTALTDHGQIQGAAVTPLGGTLAVALDGGFEPSWGDTFTMMTSVSGEFAELEFPPLSDPDLRWWADVQSGELVVGVTHFVDSSLNGVVDFDDLVRVLAEWGAPQPVMGFYPDSSGNGVVDFDDLVLVLANWGLTAPASQ